MTKPHKVNGVSVAVLDAIETSREAAIATCQRKQRYADEFAARWHGIQLMKMDPAQRYVYPCRWCRSWHVTRMEQARRYAADYYLREQDGS